MVFGVLMLLAGLAMTAASVIEFFQAKARTEVTQVHVLRSFPTVTGIGPLRHQSIAVTYEFTVNGDHIERQQLVDDFPDGPVYVRFDPKQPNNNRLTLSDTSSQILGVIAGLLLVIGLGLVRRIWSPLSRRKSASTQI